MKKAFFFTVLCSFLLIIQNPIVNANSFDLEAVQSEQKEVKEQLQTLEKKQEKLTEEEQEKQVVLNQKYSEIVTKKNAIEKAAAFLEGEIENKQPTNKEISNWSSVVVPFRSVPKIYKPIYEAAAERFEVDWNVLAAIHSIETSFSTHATMISSVGAIGHMQFMPETFKAYGVDGNGDGQINAWNLEDAIFSAANYLSANNYQNDKRKAIWHYNHAEWYVNDVLATAATFKNE